MLSKRKKNKYLMFLLTCYIESSSYKEIEDMNMGKSLALDYRKKNVQERGHYKGEGGGIWW